MYARSTTILAHPSFIDAGIKHMSDTVMPALADYEGCAGLSLLVDRDSGRCIATSSWMDEDALRGSEGPVRALRDHATEIFHGTATVERWDIAALHRDHPSPHGSCVRVTWLKLEPGHLARAIDVFKLTALPHMEDLDGFCSAGMMVDPAAGRAVVSVTWDSREAFERNQEKADGMRTAVTREMGATVLDTCLFELAIAHLHVPEMV
ncbi:conserved hypothetical protein [Rhodococcus sp. RD6.2]|uniref:hypothetical protein n=1 Tax=Rhodococcus sp. RD6.2 TaxID=260936 RepID=UPI00063B7543|nr:hypothetical protein [Rhodococcus sp. RD6.2]CRK49735.1 conserved hypothetical protein [Rhodococcus sp. RD6.2]